MSESDDAQTLVVAPEDVEWHQTELGPNFWISDDLVGSDYSTLFSAQLTKFGPGGGSPVHHHDYNHAFYFLSGTARVQIDGDGWHIKPGTFVKIAAHAEHSVTNTGGDDLIFLVIYDPPHVATD